MPQKIKFIPATEKVEKLVPPPEPAGKLIPEWYKKIPAFNSGKEATYNYGTGEVDVTLKMCVPFADTLRLGYIQKSWVEMRIDASYEGEFDFTFPTQPFPFELRTKTDLPEESFEGFHPLELVWKSQWAPKLPKGYSYLLTHPFNRDDLPFRTLTGVVDGDRFWHQQEGNVPFLLKKDFSGTIPVGTPLFQIIPFKREDWVSEAQSYDHYHQYEVGITKKLFYGAYKKMFWSKKSFK